MKLTLLTACLLFTTIFYAQCPPGDVTFSSQTDVENFIANYPNCDTISGDLIITGTVNDLSALDYILYIDGGLYIHNSQLTHISNFNTLIQAPIIIQINDNSLLTEITGFNALNLTMMITIQNNFSLITVDGFNNLPSVDGDLWISNNISLTSIDGFSNLNLIYGFFAINDCQALTSIPSFNNLNNVGWAIQFFNTGLTEISGFDNLTSIGGIDPTSGLSFSSNPNLTTVSGFNCLQTIEFDVLIQDNPILDNISGLCSLEFVGQFFTIRNNNSLSTLNGLQSLMSLSTSAYEGMVVLSIHDNPQLSDCDALCNLFSSNGLMGLTFFANNQTGCDSEADINTTNCTPFETLDCTNLNNPVDGAVGVEVDTDISWNPVTGATSYLISIGTTSGGTQIANNLDVGNTTTYMLPSNLPENTEIFVKVKPYSAIGQAKCCAEESFTTNNQTINCTSLVTPLNNSSNVAVTSNITWDEVIGATGYILNVGTSSGATDIANNLDVGKVTIFEPSSNFPENATIFVTIIPYNTSTQASGCVEENFTTEAPIPNCTTLSNPINGATNVLISTNINWNPVSAATGYLISMGTVTGGTDLVDNLDVGNVTSYNPDINLPENETIFITIIPYNVFGSSVNCIEESFSTSEINMDCSSLINPINGAEDVSVSTTISWNISNMATGYILNIGITPNGSEITNYIDLGNVNSYNVSEDLPYGTEIYVTINPYNSLGQLQTCQTQSFVTKYKSISVPKYFTPNNDGHNDKWIIQDPLNQIEVVYIYNRYGKLLKSLKDIQSGWDGSFNKHLLPVSDYWYIIKLKNNTQTTGHFTLKR